MTKQLSPAAQAVLDATGLQDTALEMAARGIAAAALRAAAAWPFWLRQDSTRSCISWRTRFAILQGSTHTLA
jgi:hypothetical protein